VTVLSASLFQVGGQRYTPQPFRLCVSRRRAFFAYTDALQLAHEPGDCTSVLLAFAS
jgi:hypothetical protein